MTSYLLNGQWTTDKNEMKYRHMFVIPFPVCVYAAINYKERQQIESFRKKMTRKIKLNKIR